MTHQNYSLEEIRQKVLSVVSEVSAIELSALQMQFLINQEIAPTSLDRVTLFMALEDEFSRSIAEEELQGIETLEDLIKFVEVKVGPTAT